MPPVFRRLDHLFRLVWIALPFLILESAGVSPLELVRGVRPPAGPLRDMVATLDPGGQRPFWLRFLSDFVVFAIGLGLGHFVIHRAATGRIFAAEILRVVRIMGWLLLVWPLAGLLLDNLVAAAFARVPGNAPFEAVYLPDILVMGFGLFLLCIAAVIAEAIRLREEADLTI